MNIKIKPAIFICLFLFLISIIVLFEINGWNHNFITFFFFSAFVLACLLSLVLEYYEADANNQLKRLRLRSNILFLSVHATALFLIGFIHILGNLTFPDFVIIDGWRNRYVIATRITWFTATFLSYLFSQSLSIDPNKSKAIHEEESKVKENRFRSSSFLDALFAALIFPAISVPLFIKVADFLGLSFIRKFVVTFIL